MTYKLPEPVALVTSDMAGIYGQLITFPPIGTSLFTSEQVLAAYEAGKAENESKAQLFQNGCEYRDHLNNELQEQLAAAQAENADLKSCIDNDRELFDVPVYTEQLERKCTAQQLVITKMREALEYYACDLGYDGNLAREALAIEPTTSLREHDAKLVERIACTEMDYYPEIDILLGIADKIRKGEWK